MLKHIIGVLLLFLSSAILAQKGALKLSQSEVKNAFYLKAYNFMSVDQYDSAQVYLNKIYQKETSRRPNLFTYYITTLQAEIYYYNNLHLLGLQQSLKGENIAKMLNDSVLIADSYNFIGLFYLNSNKLSEAKAYFKKALQFAKQPPYRKTYMELTKPHHIYGNLSETFEKLNEPDSAIFYSLLSLKLAKYIKSPRGMSTGALNTGNAFLVNNQIDSAKKYFQLTQELAGNAQEFDVELNGYGGLADCAARLEGKRSAYHCLAKGFSLLNKYPHLNDFYASMFLTTAMQVYKFYGDIRNLNLTLELKSKRETATYKKNNTQIQSLLMTGINNEKTIFKLELAEIQNRQTVATIRIYILLLVVLVLIVVFIAYRYYALQRLKLANIRTKISQDLHDEVGATLSGIAMYSYITKEQIKNNQHESVENSLDIIKDNATEMVAKLNDIVWAVKPVEENLYRLLVRLREFALQITAAKAIRLVFAIPDEFQTLKLSMELRKNIYLICKEAINNAAKYSEADLLTINLSSANSYLVIEIQDNGKGFGPNVSSQGSGLSNMANRANEIAASLRVDGNLGFGTKISLGFKIT